MMNSDLIEFMKLSLPGMSAVIASWIAYKMAQLEKNTNSKMDAVIALTKALSRAQGNVEGREELKQERKEALG